MRKDPVKEVYGRPNTACKKKKKQQQFEKRCRIEVGSLGERFCLCCSYYIIIFGGRANAATETMT